MLAALDEYAFKAFETLKGRISRFNNTRNDFACGCLHSAAALNAVPLSTTSGLAQDCIKTALCNFEIDAAFALSRKYPNLGRSMMLCMNAPSKRLLF